MRGAGDEMQIGERIAFYRQRRGYTQSQLAGLVGRSTDWLSKIERGDRQIRRVDLLTEVAAALRVTLGDLMGQPVLLEDDQERDDIPAIRDALMAPGRLSRVLFATTDAPPPDLRQAEQLVEFLWSDYQRGRIAEVVDRLPRLIRTAQQLEDGARDIGDDARRRSWAASARTHHLAATTLSKVGEADLSWIAAERAMKAADEADDPLVLASAARAATHALLAVGRYDDALSLGETAARWLDPQVAAGDPNALSLLGMLHLRTAVAAARRQDRQSSEELLGHAERSAVRLGEDGNYWQTGFGPTNVELHRLSAGLDLGDMTWVARRGENVDVGHLPVERQVTHMIDRARALSYLARDEDALGLLLDAEQAAPALVRHSAVVRETVKTMPQAGTGVGGSTLVALARARAALPCRPMNGTRPVVGLVACAVGGVESIRESFVLPALKRGWRVAVTLTPTAATWLTESGELGKLEAATGLPVRALPRQPGERSPHPPVDCYVVSPASANTVAKLALGISDNQALTTVGEALGNPATPVVVFPRVNAAHARHPAWAGHLAALRGVGTRLVYGPEIWELHEPRQAPPGRELPWGAILSETADAI